jgi:hypothetical protein
MTTATTAPAFKLSVTPYKIMTSQHSVSVPVVLTNGGPAPIKVSGQFELVQQASATGHGCAPAKAPAWATVSPSSIVIAPGQSATEHVIINSPASTQGSYDLSAVFTGHPAGVHQTGIAVGGALGVRTLVSYPGQAPQATACVQAHPVPPVAAGGSHGSPAAGIGGLVIGLGLLALVVLGVRQLIRRRRARKVAAAKLTAAQDRASSEAAPDDDLVRAVLSAIQGRQAENIARWYGPQASTEQREV